MMYASESRDPTIGTHQSALLLAEFPLKDPDIAARHFRRLSERVWGDPDALAPTFTLICFERLKASGISSIMIFRLCTYLNGTYKV
jgi:hypothetical protein